MSLTANFDFCAELALGPVKAIFHLALKNEELFPHTVGPFTRTYSGETMSATAELLDDNDDPADLEFIDNKHIRFLLPLNISVEVPSAPDPSLSRVTLHAVCGCPGALANWPVDGQDQLGIDFSGITAAAVTVPAVSGLPELNADRFTAAVHTRYGTLPTHTFTLGANKVVIYDGNRDPTLDPPSKDGSPEITTALEMHGTKRYLKVVVPTYTSVPEALLFTSYGTITFWREVVQTSTSVSVNMSSEPADAALATTIDFDEAGVGQATIKAMLKPLIVTQLGAFGTITEPWFSEAAAKEVLQSEAAAYLVTRKFPVYTPQSGDPAVPLSTPVGFLLPAAGILAILMNRRDSSITDFAPDDFLGASQVALAVGRGAVDDMINHVIATEFEGVNGGGGKEIETDEGSATLQTLSVTPSDPGDHDQAEGHLWAEGTAEVHIDCWPDPDISFSGPIFLRVTVVETDEECTMTVNPEMGDFDASQSCCDVFIDIIIPVIGWIMLAIIEDMIDKVGGELAEKFAGEQAREIQALPPFVLSVAELQTCLEALNVSSQGFVFPGKIRIRREGRSFEDLADSGNLPRP